MPSFEETRRGYQNLWRKAFVRPECVSRVQAVCRGILENRRRYEVVEAKTGVPWFWIAAVHHRESGGDFRGVLHNGERIIGTGRKTTLVPAGRGPFRTWEAAAIDALRIKFLPDIREWPVERCLYEWERFNGFGYFAKGINSPYVWGDTNLEQPGKYVADHVFDRSADDKQIGTAALLKVLIEMDDGVARRIEKPADALKQLPSIQPAPQPQPASESAWARFWRNFTKGN